MATIEPNIEEFLAVIASIPAGTPITMLNMLRYREFAEYEDADLAALPQMSGRDAYEQRYGAEALGHVARVGGEMIWGGKVVSGVIAPADEPWDDVVLVKYPSIQAFVDMTSDPDYLACSRHRTASLADSRLIATVE